MSDISADIYSRIPGLKLNKRMPTLKTTWQTCISGVPTLESLNTTTVSVSYLAYLNKAEKYVSDYALQHVQSVYELTSILCSSTLTNGSTNCGFIREDHLTNVCGAYPPAPSDDLFNDVINKYLRPLVTMLVLITNVIVCWVFLKQRMQNPVYNILLAIALAELLNSLIPLPLYIIEPYFGRYLWWLQPDDPQLTKVRRDVTDLSPWWKLPDDRFFQAPHHRVGSELLSWTTVSIPTVTYTISVLLTVLLAFQRLIYVNWPTRATKLCSLTYSRIACFTITLFSILIHIPLLTQKFVLFKPLLLRIPLTSMDKTNMLAIPFQRAMACLPKVLNSLPGFVMKCHTDGMYAMLTYYWARIVLIHIFPCCLLIVLTALLLVAMRGVAQRKARLKPPNKSQENKHYLHHLRQQSFCSPYTQRDAQVSKEDQPPRKTSDLYSPIASASIFHTRCNSALAINQTDSVASDAFTSYDVVKLSKVISHSKRTAKSNSIGMHSPTTSPTAVSKMLLVILIKFIMIHVPNAVVILCYTIVRTSRSEKSDNGTHWNRLTIFCNLLILVSNQLNFFILWRMSTDFRVTLHKTCVWNACSQLFKHCSPSKRMGFRDPTPSTKHVVACRPTSDEQRSLKEEFVQMNHTGGSCEVIHSWQPAGANPEQTAILTDPIDERQMTVDVCGR